SAYFACKKTNCKLISTFHGVYSLNLLSKSKSKLKILYNSIMLKANAVIAVSNFIKNHIQENYSNIYKATEDNLLVIHRGVDLNHFSADKVSKARMIELSRKWNLPDDK